MNERERFLNTMSYQPVDRRPLHLVGPWGDTLERWYAEGLPRGADLNKFLGVEPLRTVNVTPAAGIFPPFETRTISEDDTFKVFVDSYGRTVRDFKHRTSMPQWLDFPVKGRDDLRRVLDEHFDVSNLDARFDARWRRQVEQAAKGDALVLIDAGCYYWTLRSLAGVEVASYLFYDAPDEVDELFERYCTVVIEGLRRVSPLVHIDVMGFGEDIAYKNGPLISPAMFRQFILPRYKRVMDQAHAMGIDLTWYDSDGDTRQFIPDYLSVGVNCLAPCEVAAGMSPPELRSQFGRPLRMIGGLDKRQIARGPAAIDAQLARNRPVILDGGFIPAIDHSVSSDISFDNYRYFVDALQRALKL
jgi:hypothetical protein